MKKLWTLAVFLVLSGTAVADPICPLILGQSHVETSRAFAWKPNARAQIWNGGFDGSVGSAFVPLASATVTFSEKFASNLADQNIGRQVRATMIGAAGRPIANWLSGYSGHAVVTPDAFQNLLGNASNSLAASGCTSFDPVVWFQGDSDAGDTSHYTADWNTLFTRLSAYPWFGPSTRLLIAGTVPSSITGIPGYDAINNILQGLAAADPTNRQYVPMNLLPAGTHWDTTTWHMTGAGYYAAGALAANLSSDIGGEPWTPYSVKLGSLNGTSATGNPVGRFKVLPGHIVAVQIETHVINTNTGVFLASLPFAGISGSLFALNAMDAWSAAEYSTVISGTDVRVFTATGGQTVGNPVITGFYERQ